MSQSACFFFPFHLRFIEVKFGFCVKLNLTDSQIQRVLFLYFFQYVFVSFVFSSLCLTWGCRGHVRLSCGWPPVDRSFGASSRRQRRIYHKLTWSYLHCCCSPMAPSISSFCIQVQSKRRRGGSENTVQPVQQKKVENQQVEKSS